ncbi:MAG: hypothetical protein AB7I09_17555, partial [Planctomycetota bacterium]
MSRLGSRRAYRWVGLLAVMAWCFVVSGPASAQEGKRLSRLQQEARDYLREIEKQMEVLSERLSQTEPEDARRIENARGRLIEELIYHDMQLVSEHLDREEFIPALQKIGGVTENLTAILAILENRTLDQNQVQERLDQLAEQQRAIAELTDQQKELREQTARWEQSQQDVKDLKQAKEAVERLQAEQEQLRGQNDSKDSTFDASAQRDLQQLQEEARRLASALRDRAEAQQALEDLAAHVSELEREARNSVADRGEILDRQRVALTEPGRPPVDLGESKEWASWGEQDAARSHEAQRLQQRLGSAREQLEASGAAKSPGTRQALDAAARALAEAERAAQEAERASASAAAAENPEAQARAGRQSVEAEGREADALARARQELGAAA